MRAGQAKATEYRRKTPISTQTQQKEEGDMENITLSQDAVKGTWPLPKSISDPFQLRELSRQLDVRLEERLAERKRIAQELHDTLLQGFIGASLLLHAAVEQTPADSPSRLSLTRALRLVHQAIDEARVVLQGLRSATTTSMSLEDALSKLGDECRPESAAQFRILVSGHSRAMKPAVQEQVYLIAREALVNALRHSEATSIEVNLEYAAKHLRLVVRDNGCGIDTQVLRTGREGHWGLSGMREHTERINARLKVWSRAGAGTQIELSVPSRIAFQHQSPQCPLGWLASVFPGKTRAGDSKTNE